MPPQQITLAGDVFRICLKPVYITRGEPQDASLGKLKIAHNPPLLYLQILPRSFPDPVQIRKTQLNWLAHADSGEPNPPVLYLQIFPRSSPDLPHILP